MTRTEIMDRAIPEASAKAIKFLESITEPYDLGLPHEHAYLCRAMKQLGKIQFHLVSVKRSGFEGHTLVEIWRVR